MTQNTSLKDKALNWWRFALTLEQSVDLIVKYKLKSLVLDSEISTIYLKEHPTEAEVSKEEETVEQAVVKESNDYGNNMKVHVECAFINGANWQKEKDRELISELLEALKEGVKFFWQNERVYNRKGLKDYYPDHYIFDLEKGITKAEKHLNNQ